MRGHFVSLLLWVVGTYLKFLYIACPGICFTPLWFIV